MAIEDAVKKKKINNKLIKKEIKEIKKFHFIVNKYFLIDFDFI